jgi:hypothetical protein
LTAWLFGKYSLKGKLQVEALLHYVIDEPPENADNKQAFKYIFLHLSFRISIEEDM